MVEPRLVPPAGLWDRALWEATTLSTRTAEGAQLLPKSDNAPWAAIAKPLSTSTTPLVWLRANCWMQNRPALGIGLSLSSRAVERRQSPWIRYVAPGPLSQLG